MDFHKHLQKQIKKHLSVESVENPEFKNFLNAINETYVAFDRDLNLMNRAFEINEREFHEINDNLKKEYDLKKHSIANLYNSLEILDEDFNEIKNEKGEEDELLFISKYLNLQIEKKDLIEKNLSTTLELLKTLLANLQSGILVEDENRRILFTNHLFCDMFSIPLSPEEMFGIDCTNSAEQSKHLFKETEKFSPRINELLKHRKISTNEVLETKDNRFLERDYIPIFIDDEYKGHLWKYTDITQRIKTQILLEQSEERSRLIMNSALNAIITVDTKGKIIFWNDRAEVIFGWKKEEIIGKTLAETIIPNQHVKGHENGMKHYMKTGEGPALNKLLELPGLRKNGQEFPLEISIIPIKQNDELFFCSFIQDISLRKAAVNTLKYQEEKFRNIIANMNLGLIEVDNDEVIQFANQSFAEMSGYEMNELIGKSPGEVFVFGENFEILNSKRSLRNQGISDLYQIPIKNKRGEIKWWAISGAPNYDDKGNLVGSIGIHLDITAQKELEIEIENEKIKAEKASKSKEIFLANMSHEIRTPLNAIIGFLRELEKQELSVLQKKYVENSTIASKHLLAIINNILDISKIEAGEMSIDKEDFILENTINNVVRVLSPKAEQKGLNLYVNFDKNIDKILKGDALRIEQILFNLLGNSLKFTQKGKIVISCDLIAENKDSQNLRISISDTGIGMDKEFINTIFKKFSQEDKEITRKFGGTGLGMAITKELIQLMKGSIELESEKNVGTTIRIYLNFPRINAEFKKEIATSKKTINIEGTKILLVEDNDFNRMVAQSSLQYFKCVVTEAENGLEALEILKKQNFDIILMDIQMPEMDGIETTIVIRNEYKLQTPIIALTANAFKTEIEKCKSVGMDDYITKPFEEYVLMETILKNLYKTNNALEVKESFRDKLYNLNSLHNLSRGNKDFVIKMVNIFINQTTEIISKIKEAIENEDFKTVSAMAHKLKPSVEGVGVLSILDEIRFLEKISKETNDKQQMKALFDSIQLVLEEVIIQLKENEFS